MDDGSRDFEKAFTRAREETRIVRTRKNLLFTFGATRLPYVCLSPQEGIGRVRLRRGEVTSERPSIELPGAGDWNAAGYGFVGFDGDDGPAEKSGNGRVRMIPVSIARRVAVPPARYVNTPGGGGLEDGPLEAAVNRVIDRLEGEHDIRTGVFTAPEAVWNLAVLVYVGSQMMRSAPSNIAEHMERIRLNQRG